MEDVKIRIVPGNMFDYPSDKLFIATNLHVNHDNHGHFLEQIIEMGGKDFLIIIRGILSEIFGDLEYSNSTFRIPCQGELLDRGFTDLGFIQKNSN